MNYLIVRPWKDQFCSVTIVSEGSTFEDPMEEWALRTGEQILYVNNRMANDLKMFYMQGNYQTGAVHLIACEEMCAIMASRLGPSDRERYEMALLESKQGRAAHRANRHPHFYHWFAGAVDVLMHLFKICVKFLSFVLILPFLVSWIRGRDK
jgi:hypothetical protein